MVTGRRVPLEFHPLANLFPLMEGAEAEALGDDIKANGQREPIWLLEGTTLDGRNRYLQCCRVGVEPVTSDYDGEGPLAFVISMNLKRRHLNESQRAWVASRKSRPSLTAATVRAIKRQICRLTRPPRPGC